MNPPSVLLWPPAGPARPFVVGGAEAWAVFVCRAVLPTRTTPRSGCGRRRCVQQHWSVGSSPTYLCWTQRPNSFIKTCFGCSAVCPKSKRLKRHLARCYCGCNRRGTGPLRPRTHVSPQNCTAAPCAGQKRDERTNLKRQLTAAAAASRHCLAPARRCNAAQVRAARQKKRAPAAQNRPPADPKRAARLVAPASTQSNRGGRRRRKPWTTHRQAPTTRRS